MLSCYSEIRDVDGLQCDLPHKPYCCDCLEAGVAIRPLKTALRHKYIELNPPHVKKFLTFDLDYPSWPYIADDVFLPRPLWYVENTDIFDFNKFLFTRRKSDKIFLKIKKRPVHSPKLSDLSLTK